MTGIYVEFSANLVHGAAAVIIVQALLRMVVITDIGKPAAISRAVVEK